MGRHAHRQRQRAFGTGGFTGGARTFNGLFVPGDNHLARRIVVHRRDHLPFGRLFTGFGDSGVVQTDNRGHGAGTFRYGFLHEFTTQLNQANGISETDNARAYQRGVFAEAVTRQQRWRFAALLLPDAVQRHGGGEQRRLSLPGLIQFFCRALLRQRPQIVTQRCGSFTEGLFNDRPGGSHFGQHAYGLRALPREHKCELRHV